MGLLTSNKEQELKESGGGREGVSQEAADKRQQRRQAGAAGEACRSIAGKAGSAESSIRDESGWENLGANWVKLQKRRAGRKHRCTFGSARAARKMWGYRREVGREQRNDRPTAEGWGYLVESRALAGGRGRRGQPARPQDQLYRLYSAGRGWCTGHHRKQGATENLKGRKGG